MKTVGIEPMVVELKHPQLEIVANLINQRYLQKRLASDKVPYNAILAELVLMRKHIVNERLGRSPRHPFLHILPHQIAILAS